MVGRRVASKSVRDVVGSSHQLGVVLVGRLGKLGEAVELDARFAYRSVRKDRTEWFRCLALANHDVAGDPLEDKP